MHTDNLTKGLILLALCLCSACGVHRLPPETVREVAQDTVYRTVIRRDTIRDIRHSRDTLIQRDSVFVKGETVYREKYIYKTSTVHDTAYVYRFLRDTMYVARRDSIPVPVYVDRVEKVKYTPGYMKTLAGIGGVCCIAALIWLLFLYLRRKL